MRTVLLFVSLALLANLILGIRVGEVVRLRFRSQIPELWECRDLKTHLGKVLDQRMVQMELGERDRSLIKGCDLVRLFHDMPMDVQDPVDFAIKTLLFQSLLRVAEAEYQEARRNAQWTESDSTGSEDVQTGDESGEDESESSDDNSDDESDY